MQKKVSEKYQKKDKPNTWTCLNDSCSIQFCWQRLVLPISCWANQICRFMNWRYKMSEQNLSELQSVQNFLMFKTVLSSTSSTAWLEMRKKCKNQLWKKSRIDCDVEIAACLMQPTTCANIALKFNITANGMKCFLLTPPSDTHTPFTIGIFSVNSSPRIFSVNNPLPPPPPPPHWFNSLPHHNGYAK